MAETAEPTSAIETRQVTDALRTLIGRGLPATEGTAGPLLQLRSVYARAIDPGNPVSRLLALNTLLPRLIGSLDDDRYREALQTLFGLAPGTRGALLTARRRQAAATLGYGPDHFRSAIERELLGALALALQEDLLRYAPRTRRAAGSLEATGDTPRLGPEHITAEEELISRIWEHVYGLRADLIAVARLEDQDGMRARAEEHAQAAKHHRARLRELIATYTETYGKDLIQHGDAEFAAGGLARLSQWV